MRSSPTCVRLHSSLPPRLMPALRAAVLAAGGSLARSGGSMLALLCSGALWCNRKWWLARTASDSSAGPVVSRNSLKLVQPLSWKLRQEAP